MKNTDATNTCSAESAKQMFEPFFLSFVEHSPDMFFLYLPSETRHTYVSNAATAIFGFSPDEFVSTSCSIEDRVHPDWKEEYANHWRVTLEGEGLQVLDFPIFCKDGNTKWVKEKVLLVENEGSENHVCGVISDISEEKRLQKDLTVTVNEIEVRSQITELFLTSSGEELYNSVLQIVLKVTGSEFGLFGYINEQKDLVIPTMTREIWSACTVEEKVLVFPQDQWGDSIWARALSQKKLLYSNEVSANVPEGHIPIQCNIAAPIIHNDRVIGLFHVANKKERYTEADIRMMEIITGITAPVLENRLQFEKQELARTALEMNLATDRKRLLSVFDGIEDVIYVSDPDTYELLFVNEIVRKSWEGKKYLGEKCHVLLQGREEPCPFCTNKIIFGEKLGHPHIWEFQNEINGRWYRCSDKAIRWINGKMVRFEIAADITSLKSLEQQLTEKNAKLHLSNKELEQFAYVASHDLQEPLRMVASYTELLQIRYQDQLDEKANKYIRYAVEGAKRMQQLINDLLAISRVNTRGRPLVPVDCNELLKKVLHGLGKTIHSAEASITVEPLPIIKGDDGQLFQLFQNLIANAIKFHGEKKPEIDIFATQEDAFWKFCIKDNGIGIDKQFFERIFVIFQRLHEREIYPGTGIGLAIAKKIVDRHGGRIWVESEQGIGSAFYFTLQDAKS